jgi:putative intracellular protease/amidase
MLYASICATPALFLAPNKLLIKKATCFSTFNHLILKNGYEYLDKPYIIDDNCSNLLLLFIFLLTSYWKGTCRSTSIRIEIN